MTVLPWGPWGFPKKSSTRFQGVSPRRPVFMPRFPDDLMAIKRGVLHIWTNPDMINIGYKMGIEWYRWATYPITFQTISPLLLLSHCHPLRPWISLMIWGEKSSKPSFGRVYVRGDWRLVLFPLQGLCFSGISWEWLNVHPGNHPIFGAFFFLIHPVGFAQEMITTIATTTTMEAWQKSWIQPWHEASQYAIGSLDSRCIIYIL